VGGTHVELALLAGDRVAIERRVLRMEQQFMRHVVDLALKGEIISRLEVLSDIAGCECAARRRLVHGQPESVVYLVETMGAERISLRECPLVSPTM
jgi:hypothetical protein